MSGTRYLRVKAGAKVFVPARNSQRRGYLMGDYYDVSQTTGKPMKEPVPLAENSGRMEAALGALMNYSPVPITEGQELGAPARYDERNLCIAIDPSYGEAEVFSALATEIGYARGHDKGRNMDFDRRDYQAGRGEHRLHAVPPVRSGLQGPPDWRSRPAL